MIKISVIIPTYGRENILCETIKSVYARLQAIASQTCYEIIVVDQTKQHSSYVNNFIRKCQNEGVIKYIVEDFANLPNARNVGVKNSSGDIVVFLDDDVILHENFFENILNRYSDKSIMSVVGLPILKNENGENILLESQSRMKSIARTILKALFCRKKSWVISKCGLQICSDAKSKAGLVDAGRGCCMSFRREVFDIVGLFDSNYVGNALREESDFFCRMKKNRLNVFFDPEVCLDHIMANVGGCRSDKGEQYWKIYFDNQFYFYKKNFGFCKLYIVLLLVFDVIHLRRKKLDVFKLVDESYKRALSFLS